SGPPQWKEDRGMRTLEELLRLERKYCPCKMRELCVRYDPSVEAVLRKFLHTLSRDESRGIPKDKDLKKAEGLRGAELTDLKSLQRRKKQLIKDGRLEINYPKVFQCYFAAATWPEVQKCEKERDPRHMVIRRVVN